MHKEKITYKGQEIEVITFDTTVNPNASKKTQLKQIEQLLKEEKDTKSGKRPIKEAPNGNSKG